MSTRAAAARKAVLVRSVMDEEASNVSNVSDVTMKSHSDQFESSVNDGNLKKDLEKRIVIKNTGKRHSKSDRNLNEDHNVVDREQEIGAMLTKDTGDIFSTPKFGGKRKGIAPSQKKNGIVRKEPIRGGWDELPHGMGRIEDAAELNNETLNDNTVISDVRPNKRVRKTTAKTEDITNGARTAGGVAIKQEDEKNGQQFKKHIPRSKASKLPLVTSDLPGDVDPITEELREEDAKEEFDENIMAIQVGKEHPKKKKSSQIRKKKLDTSKDVKKKVNDLVDAADSPIKRIKKGKANPYGLTPGETPFPDFVMPSPEACKAVEDALSKIHGKVEAPKEIPAPSLEVTGCGEVPSVLDALIRTRLSASTTSQNSNNAFKGLVERYGLRKEGIGEGSVDWNKVRMSDVLDIEKAIKRGGLAKTKSVSIKKILEMVHDLNITRHDAFIKENEGADISHIIGADRMSQGQKDMEIEIVKQGVLSLDFMHGLTAEEAMNEFVKFPGIGVKTASCVILFCLRRPSFAVDTHVWRLCKWLKWVPEGATRDQTFSHCEVRVPNEVKYSLHQLFIRHGKTCGRCRAITGESSEVWETTACPIEHLVERTGKKRGGPPPKKSGARKKIAIMSKKKMRQIEESEEDEAEMSELSDLSDLGGKQFGDDEEESSDDDILSSSSEE